MNLTQIIPVLSEYLAGLKLLCPFVAATSLVVLEDSTSLDVGSGNIERRLFDCHNQQQ